MGKEIDLLKNYPKAKRDLTKRLENKTEEVRSVARKFDKEFFDGERKFGYGGFSYNSKYWSEVVKDFIDYYNLDDGSKILDVGCAKGFMLYDLFKLNSNLDLHGVDISKYAIENSVTEINHKLQVANATNLPYEDNFFDLVIAINTIHNLDKAECATALKEISRVSKNNAFLTVDAYRNNEEKQRMYAWNLTAKTIMSVEEWIKFFDQNNYDGDYFWFIP
jgi:ubiquinone/menaquinone biosynthesis C-methylase UbiE